MATVLLVAMTMAQLLHSSRALNSKEWNQFMASPQVTLTSIDNTHFRMVSNGIPDHATGDFPGQGNPNSIKPQNYNIIIPRLRQLHRRRFPKVAESPSCLPMGPIAFAKNGVPIFNPLNSGGENAVELETFDDCNGHPDRFGVYHYHQNPKCLLNGGREEFIGVALDGFPIYGNKDCNGINITSADLDYCHGRYEEVSGQNPYAKKVESPHYVYRYRVTNDYPYILGCFKGELSSLTQLQHMLSRNCEILHGSSNANMVTSCP